METITIGLAGLLFVSIGYFVQRRHQLRDGGCPDCGGALIPADWWFGCKPCRKEWSLDGLGRRCWQFLDRKYMEGAALPRAEAHPRHPDHR